MNHRQVVSILRTRVSALEAYTAALSVSLRHVQINASGWECMGGCKSLRQCLERRAKEEEDILSAFHKLQRTPGEPKSKEEDR